MCKALKVVAVKKPRNMTNALIVRAFYRKAYPIIESLKRAGYRVIAGIDTMVSEAFFHLP